jgi:tetratricopeptide (TPR) repeat protein
MDRSLLRQAESARYDMHELLRQLAAEKLRDEPGAEEATVSLHSAFFAQFLHAREATLGDVPAVMHELANEIYNLKAAWQTAVRRLDLPVLRRMIRGMAQLWYNRGLFQQAEARLAEAASALEAELAHATDTAEAQAVLGRVLVERSIFLERSGKPEDALVQLDQALGLGQAIGDDYIQAYGYLQLANIQWSRGHAEAAEESTRLGLQKAERAGDARLTLIALAGLSIILRSQGQIEASLALDEQALERAQAIGSFGLMGVLLSNLGSGYSASGDFARARGRLDRALEMRRHTGDQLGAGTVLLHLGCLSLAMGQLSQAQQQLDEALTAFEAMANGRYCVEALAHRALVHLARRADKAARQDAAQAVERAAALEIRQPLALAHLAFARIAWAQGERGAALDSCSAALTLARTHSDRELILPALAGQARAVQELGDWPAAQDIVGQMLPLPEQISFRPIIGTVDAYLVVSQVLAPVDPSQAQAILRHVHRRLLAAAATIDDLGARQAFLHDNPTHQRILALMGVDDP